VANTSPTYKCAQHLRSLRSSDCITEHCSRCASFPTLAPATFRCDQLFFALEIRIITITHPSQLTMSASILRLVVMHPQTSPEQAYNPTLIHSRPCVSTPLYNIHEISPPSCPPDSCALSFYFCDQQKPCDNLNNSIGTRQESAQLDFISNHPLSRLRLGVAELLPTRVGEVLRMLKDRDSTRQGTNSTGLVRLKPNIIPTILSHECQFWQTMRLQTPTIQFTCSNIPTKTRDPFTLLALL